MANKNFNFIVVFAFVCSHFKLKKLDCICNLRLRNVSFHVSLLSFHRQHHPVLSFDYSSREQLRRDKRPVSFVYSCGIEIQPMKKTHPPKGDREEGVKVVIVSRLLPNLLPYVAKNAGSYTVTIVLLHAQRGP